MIELKPKEKEIITDSLICLGEALLSNDTTKRLLTMECVNTIAYIIGGLDLMKEVHHEIWDNYKEEE